MKTNLAVFFLAFFKSTYFSRLGFGLLDQGESLHNAQRISLGNLIYRDFYSIFPPLDNYIFYLFSKLLGESIFLSRLWQSLLFSFSALFLFIILKNLVNKNMAIFASIIYIFLDINVERLFIFAPIFLSIILYLRGMQNNSPKGLLFSGLVLGVVTLIRFDLPGTYILSFLVASFFYFKSSKTYYFQEFFLSNSLFIMGLIIPTSTAFLWIVSKQIFIDFMQSTIVNPLVITRLHSIEFPHVFELFPKGFGLSSLSQSFSAFFAWFILFVLFLSIISVFGKEKKNIELRLTQLVFTLSTLFSLPYIFGRSDLGHFIKGGIGFLFLAPFIFRLYENRVIKFLIISGLAFILVVGVAKHIFWAKFNDEIIIIDKEALIVNSVYVKGSTLPSAETLVKANEFIRANSQQDEKVLLLPYMAGLYYLTDRNPSTKYNNVLAGFITTKEAEKDFIAKNKDVNVVVYDPVNGPKMKTPLLRQYNPLIHEFVINNFRIIEVTEEGWLFMLKK